ncbi:hypothetical protein [Leisingera sp. M658]|uniref:hypothetical protein n=1 Tax=Leisingera sp. M658 TaxID=2867015 RepID=UPI0021A4EC5D|nr:hypothetical protein [Leisingera sp. M658]UWQ73606.1 hypothetical protein K3724_13730 [Leisingera sp. M658]
MPSIFDKAENYSWDNIQPLSKGRLQNLQNCLQSKSIEIIDLRPIAEQAKKTLPPINEKLVEGIVRQIENREEVPVDRSVGEHHLKIIRSTNKPKA